MHQASSCDVHVPVLSDDAVDIETALNQVGVGVFQWLALLVCGLANAADAVEILGMSLVLPAAEGDPGFELTTSGKSALSSCIFLGMLLGGILWGPMGDVLGRRQSLLIALLINAFFGMMSAGARSIGPLIAMRLLGGVGVGGSVPVVFSFLAELLPARVRGRFMVGLAAHWMLGSIYSAGMGWAIIPSGPDRWRLFLVVASLPAWCAAVGTWFMPESPRFLLVQGDTEAAEQVLQRMAAINKRRRLQPIKLIPHQGHHHHLATTPPPPPADDDGGVSQQLHSHSPEVSSAQQADMGWQHAHGHHSQQHHAAAIHELEAPQRHRGGGHGGSSSSSGGVRASSSSGGAGGGRGHSSSSSSQRGSGRGRGVSGAGRQHQQEQQWKQQQRQCCKSSFAATRMLLQPPLRRRFLPLLVAWLGLCGGWYSTVLWIPEYFKARGSQSASLYAETFAVAAANLPGNIASVFMVDCLGRRWTACVCLAGACVAALLFAFAPADPLWSVTAACIFNGISTGGWNALDLLSAELFATEVRSTAMGLLGGCGRLASFATTFMAGALMQVLLWSPLLVAAALLAAGSIAIMLLPEMAHKPLEDTVQDAEDAEVVMTALTLPEHHRQHRSSWQHQQQQQQHESLEAGTYRGSRSGGGGRGGQRPYVEVEMAPSPAAAAVNGIGHADGRAAAAAGGEIRVEEDIKDERFGLLKAAAAL